MAEEVLLQKGWGNVDVQVGGPGHNWIYFSSCASMSGPSVPYGGTEIRWCQDPDNGTGFLISSIIRTAPDQIGFDLMSKLSKVDKLKQLLCPFALRARYTQCAGSREDPMNYNPIMLAYSPAYLQNKDYDDLVASDPNNNDEIPITTPVQAPYEYRVALMTAPIRVGSLAELGDSPINDIEACGIDSCGGVCNDPTERCSTVWAVTDADAAPYANPILIKGSKNYYTKAVTWTTQPILGINGNVEGIECAGNRLIVSSNADSVIAYNDSDGDQDEWVVVAIGTAPSAYHSALYARTAREIWLACNAGYLYKSIDGGLTWTAMLEGEITTENLNAVYAYDSDLVYVVGDNGVILKSVNGGATWDDMTEVATTAANLIVVKVPPHRPREVYVGSNDGQVFKSTDEGDTFARLAFTGDGVGTIDDLEFVGPWSGEVLFILHNDGGPRGRILRDLSGGGGGADVEVVSGYEDVITGGVELNALAPCDINNVLAGGELSGGYPVIIEAA